MLVPFPVGAEGRLRCPGRLERPPRRATSIIEATNGPDRNKLVT